MRNHPLHQCIAAQLIWLRIATGRAVTRDVTACLSTIGFDVPNPLRRSSLADVETALEFEASHNNS
jgi:hypothetical protein